jgi:levanase/fructan beta-fructosidase
MTYQWSTPRHGGYATSQDLLHWEDKGAALVPSNPKSVAIKAGAKANVSGKQVYSGSGIVIDGSMAKKITGSTKPALVTFYTGVGVGTCIAWSNDQGKTWNNYNNNPVAHATNGASPRDPMVFWYEPEKKWVLAIYEGGITFYDSKDLIEWNKLSRIKWGHECPDVIQLPLDDDPNQKKWVLYDAHGYYLVGQFDGTQFIKEQEQLKMNPGPDFYGAQTFFPDNMPDKKIIQIAWMDVWNGGIGERDHGWERNTTFPVELKLISHDGKFIVTRNPINQIKDIYKSSKSWNHFTLGSATRKELLDPLEDISSKTFDLSFEINTKEATAMEIQLDLNGYLVRYDLDQEKIILKGRFERRRLPIVVHHPLKADKDGVVKFRFLVDWSCLEIFGNDGIFSYSEQYGFRPENSSINFTVIGGKVTFKNVHFHEISSTWK